MATEQDKPVDRDAWRRLLENDSDMPPVLTDARIRAAARRALAPRAKRWWLPASLAASLLLAVLVVQWQYGEQGPPAVISESDYAAPPAEDAASQQDAPAPPAPAQRVVPQAAEQPAVNKSRAADAVSADAAKREPEEPTEITVGAGRRREDSVLATPSSPVTVTGVSQEDLAGNSTGVVGQLQKPHAVLPAPEDWYASIEDLRAAGHHEEADRELERLEAAYPGWLEKNRPRNR